MRQPTFFGREGRDDDDWYSYPDCNHNPILDHSLYIYDSDYETSVLPAQRTINKRISSGTGGNSSTDRGHAIMVIDVLPMLTPLQ